MSSDQVTLERGGVLICFAVKEEAAPFLRSCVSKQLKILITGMGGKNAERALAKTLAEFQPEMVLTCGFAGGLNPALRGGEVVFSADENFPLHSRLAAAGAKPASFFCAKRVATSAREKSKLRSDTGRDVVEMESEIIRRICHERKIPGATIRVISDSADQDLPLDFNRLMNSNCELSLAKLILTVLIRPWKIPALMRLQKKSQAAAENLGRVLEKLLI